MRAGTEQLDACLIANLHAPTGEQRHAPAQVRQLGAFAKIQLGARRAKLIVEMVNRRVVLLADVAVLRLDDFAKVSVVLDFLWLDVRRWREIWRGEHRLAA